MDGLKFEVLTPEKIDTPPLESGTDRDFQLINLNVEVETVEQPALAPEVHIPTETNNSPASNKSEDATLGSPTGQDSPADSVVTLVILYGQLDIASLIKCASISKSVREFALSDRLWVPILNRIGVHQRQTMAPTQSLVSLDDPNAVNILGVQYSGNAHNHFKVIQDTLLPFCKNPEEITRVYSTQLSAQAQVVLNAKKFADLTGQEKWISSLSIQENALAVQLLDKVRQALEERNAKNLELSSSAMETLGSDGKEIIELCIDSNKGFTEIAREPTSENRGGNEEHEKLSCEEIRAILAPATAGLDRLALDMTALPPLWRHSLAEKSAERVVNIVDTYFTEYLTDIETHCTSSVYLDSMFTLITTLLELSGTESWVSNPSLQPKIVEKTLEPLKSAFLRKQTRMFSRDGEEKIADWSEKLADKESAKERFIWSSVPKSSEKKTFLNSFIWSFGGSTSSADANAEEANKEANESQTAESQSHGQNTTKTIFEAQTAVLIAKLQNMESLVSMELTLDLIEQCRTAMRRATAIGAPAKYHESLFVELIDLIDRQHIQQAFDKAIETLNDYDPKRYGRLVIQDSEQDSLMAVEPLAIFAELVNIGDIVQQLIHVFFEKELVTPNYTRKSDFTAPSVNAKRKFEQTLDERLAEGLSRGIDVLMDQVDFILSTEQLGSDYCPIPEMGPPSLGPTSAAEKVIDLTQSHLDLLRDSTEKNIFDVFQQEVGLRLYHSITRHIKRQTINLDGAITLLGDINFYYKFVTSLKRKPLTPYYEALKQIGQLYLIDTSDARQLGAAAADMTRFKGVMSSEELVEFMRRRQDWPLVRGKVEKVLYGITECTIC